MPAAQLDLFPEPREPSPARAADPLLLGSVRRELSAMLEAYRAAARLPEGDLTKATVAELRFHSLARALPEAEAAALTTAFDAELDRLYALEERARAAGSATEPGPS